MPTPRRSVTFRVRFNDVLFAEDLARCRAEGRQIGRQARIELERNGAPQELLTSCGAEHRDGTDLPRMVKLTSQCPTDPGGSSFKAPPTPPGCICSRSRSENATPHGAPASTTSPTTANTAPGRPECTENRPGGPVDEHRRTPHGRADGR